MDSNDLPFKTASLQQLSLDEELTTCYFKDASVFEGTLDEFNALFWPEYATIEIENAIFKVKAKPLLEASRYFSGAFNPESPWIEVQRKSVKITDFHSASFLAFIHWLFENKIDESNILLPDTLSPCFDEDDTEEIRVGNREILSFAKGDRRLDNLVDTYILGEYLQAPGFLNEVIVELILQYSEFYRRNFCRNRWIPLHNLDDIFERTVETSPLRRMVLDLLCTCLTKNVFKQAVKDEVIPAEVIAALATRAIDQAFQRPPQQPWSQTEVYRVDT